VDRGQERFVYRLKTHQAPCRFAVVEIARAGEYLWNVTGYPTLEAFQNKHRADGQHSALPEQQVLSCPMIK
jgi:hypothetical protein